MTTHGSKRLVVLAFAGLALLLPACQSDGQFSLLGYRAGTFHDCNIRTVRVPIFENVTFRQGLEFDLTQAVIREIESRTPYKVVSGDTPADTELTGRIIAVNKFNALASPLNEIRLGQTTLAVEVVWRDLRTGEALSRPMKRPVEMALPDGSTTDTPPGPGVPVPPPGTGALTPPKPVPVLVRSNAEFLPELGQSITSSFQVNVNRLAVSIVNLMEKPW